MRPLSPTTLGLAAALSLTACGGGPEFTAGGRALPTPEDPGVYVLTTEGELSRIDGSAEWERKTWPNRADFSPGVEFIVHEPALAGGNGQDVQLWRVAWLRSELQPTGQAAPVNGNQWVVADLDALRVPLAATPHPEMPGVLHLDPGERLDPGLYELQLSPPGAERRQGRFGVLWNSLDKRGYSAAHCVDRVSGGATFQPCTVSHTSPTQAGYQAFASGEYPGREPLKIEFLETRREEGGLRIQGAVRNLSGHVETVPMLRATVLDASGRPTDSWTFAPPRNQIAPGDRMIFASWRPVGEGASRLNVDFVRTNQHAGLQ